MSSADLDFCRICFREDGNISVFDYKCDDAWSLTDRIFECVSVQISPNDKLPQVICEYCLEHVIKWCEFKTVSDRNQRAWFLWLKSLSFATPQEIREGLAENARKKNVELGQSCNVPPEKSAFQLYNKSSASKPSQQQKQDSSDDDCVIVIDEETADRSNNGKRLKIESTQSLVDVYSTKGAQFESPNQKLTNGYLFLDNGDLDKGPSKESEGAPSSTKEVPQTVVSSHESNKDDTTPLKQSSKKDGVSNENELIVEGDANKIVLDNLTTVENDEQSDHSSAPEDGHFNDDDDNDAEIENAFSTGPSNDAISDREVALLNGIDPPENGQNSSETNNMALDSSDLNCGNHDREVSLDFTVPSVPKRFGSPHSQDILRSRLLQGVGPSDARISPSDQPKRPDTPYPHEILKNMAPVLETLPNIKIFPPRISSPIVKPVEASQIQVGAVQDPEQSSGPVPLIKPVGFSLLTGSGAVSSSSISVKDLSPGQLQLQAQNESQESVQAPRALPMIMPVGYSHLINDIPLASGRLSESSDSSSYQQLDPSVRVKQEPLSEDEYSDDNDSSFSNISIKMEPMEYGGGQQGEQGESTPVLPPPNCSYCDVCNKRFSCHVHLVRHILHSAIHKRVSSFKALGHKVDSRVISQLSKEVRSQALFRSYARRQMKAMETKSTTRQFNNELLECKICNVILQSRSHKIKHDNSLAHKSRLGAETGGGEIDANNEGVMAGNETLSPLDRQSPFVSPQYSQAGPSHQLASSTPLASGTSQTIYKCPFASCNVIFNDGGQLIVHMHTHGISLPMHEVNKQIELSQKQQKKCSGKKYIPVDGKFPCRRCNRVFIKALSLSNHLRRCRGLPAPKPPTMMIGQSVQCPICLIVQKNKRTLKYHIKMYHPNSQLATEPAMPVPGAEMIGDVQSDQDDTVCPVCNKQFSSRLHLRSHSYKVHQMKPVACKICKKLFQSKDKLHVHYRKGHLKMKDGEFVCYSCFQIFPNKSECWRHKKLGCSLKMRLFTCTDCNHSFKSEDLLDKHKEEEHIIIVPKIEMIPPPDLSFLEDIKNTTCHICGRGYTSYHNLKRHVRSSHMDESDNASLISSRNIVTDMSEHSVSLTDYSISDITAMNIPPRRTRNNNCERNYPCLYCDGKFSTNSNRLSHMKTVCRAAPPRVVCQNCQMERGAWVTGPCKHCGKDVTTRKRSGSISIEPVLKKPKLNELQPEMPFIQTPVPSPELYPPSMRVNKNNCSNYRLYKCAVGKRTFLSQKTMLSHSSGCNGMCKDQRVHCKICSLVFPSPKIYLKHKPCTGRKPLQKPFPCQRRRRNLPKTIPCQFCDFKFSNRKSCLFHMRKQHNYYISAERKKLMSMTYTEYNPVKQEEDFSNPFIGQEEHLAEEVKLTDVESVADQSVMDNIDPDDHTCQACVTTFGSHSALLQHIKYIHKNKFATIDCTFCSKNIFKRELYEHGFSCIKDQLANISTLECVVCSTVFYSSDEEDTLSLKLQEHIMNCCGRLSMGKGEKFKNKEKFLCLKCCMLFSSKKSLYAHSYKRHGILIQTSPNSQLKNMALLEGEDVTDNSLSEMIEEDYDSVQFLDNDEPLSTSSSPVINLAAPTNLFSCHRCSKQFKTSKGLKCHKASAHLYQSRKKKRGLPSLKCQYCQRHFFNEMKLRNHEKVHGIVQELVLTEGAEKGIPTTPADAASLSPKELEPFVKQEAPNIVGAVSEPES